MNLIPAVAEKVNRKCDLCSRCTDLTNGDFLLYQDDFCYIVINGNTDGCAKRISLVTIAHIKGDAYTEKRSRAILSEYVKSMGITEFFIRKTMRSYPDHFHIHAYVLPSPEAQG